MPHRFSSDEPIHHVNHDQSAAHHYRANMWDRTWHKVESWLKKDAEDAENQERSNHLCDAKERDELKKNPSRKVLPGLPRPQTFQRQNSERRDRLCPHRPDADERRALSVDRRAAATYLREISPSPYSRSPPHSAPDVSILEPQDRPTISVNDLPQDLASVNLDHDVVVDVDEHTPRLERAPSISVKSFTDEQDRLLIQAELEAKWILNLSMHFKDRSEREKFFVTYAEEPNKWRRVTVSCDYRNPSSDSLEEDLKSLRYQRDKSARIYESIRDSLQDIEFYPTVTNLKLKTMEGRLHVHCSEDQNEIIPYPNVPMLRYLSCPFYRESDVEFVSHMSGFVYKVNVDGNILVKKEIPGPEAVDEFLYELTALASLRDAKNVIQFKGLVVDDEELVVKGLLIELASSGALIDLIYESRFSDLQSWSRRERWARQIVRGLSEVHEAGFVQGDFTISNIVADEADNLWLIDINRRGCPVGWEPPELEDMIQSGQRISMFIGVKTDLFQLGMVLWAVAMCSDEPEMETRPLRQITRSDVPQWFQDVVDICLSPDPRKRLPARELLNMFPSEISPRANNKEHDYDVLMSTIPEVEYLVPEVTYNPDDSRPILHDVDFKAPSQISELSSVHTYPVGTSASSEYMFDPHDLSLDRRHPRDASPVTQSDCERPRTRDESDFGSRLDLSSTIKSFTSSSTPVKHPERMSVETIQATIEPEILGASCSDIGYSVSTLAPDLSLSTNQREPLSKELEANTLSIELPNKKEDHQSSSEIGCTALHNTSSHDSASPRSTPIARTPQLLIDGSAETPRSHISVDQVTAAMQDDHKDHHLAQTP